MTRDLKPFGSIRPLASGPRSGPYGPVPGTAGAANAARQKPGPSTRAAAPPAAPFMNVRRRIETESTGRRAPAEPPDSTSVSGRGRSAAGDDERRVVLPPRTDHPWLALRATVARTAPSRRDPVP